MNARLFSVTLLLTFHRKLWLLLSSPHIERALEFTSVPSVPGNIECSYQKYDNDKTILNMQSVLENQKTGKPILAHVSRLVSSTCYI